MSINELLSNVCVDVETLPAIGNEMLDSYMDEYNAAMVSLEQHSLALENINSSIDSVVVAARNLTTHRDSGKLTPEIESLVMDNVRRDVCKVGLDITVPSFESVNEYTGDISISMEGLGDAFKRLWDGVKRLTNGLIDAMGRVVKALFDLLTKVKRRVAKQGKELASTGDTLRNQTIPMSKWKYLYVEGKKLEGVDVEDLKTLKSELVELADLSVLRDAMETCVKALEEDEGGTSKSVNKSVMAVNEGLMKHYGLEKDSPDGDDSVGGLMAQLESLFLMQPLSSKKTYMGGLRLRGSAAVVISGREKVLGKIYLNTLRVSVVRPDKSNKPGNVPAISRKEAIALNDAMSDVIGSLSDTMDEFKTNTAVLRKFSSDISKLKRPTLADIAVATAGGVMVGGLPGGLAAVVTNVFAHKLTTPIARVTGDVINHGVRVVNESYSYVETNRINYK